MKTFIIVIHIAIGLLLIFLNVNNLLQLANLATQSPDNQYYYGISLSQGFTEAILGAILGLLSIIGAIAFGKDKSWAIITLPIITLLMIGMVFYTSRSATGFAASAAVLPALILFIFFVLEILYVAVLKKRAQPNQFQ